jgi:hypothetical protein
MGSEMANRNRIYQQLGGGTARPHRTLTASVTLDWQRVVQALIEDGGKSLAR